MIVQIIHSTIIPSTILHSIVIIYLINIVLMMRAAWKMGLRTKAMAIGSLHSPFLNIAIFFIMTIDIVVYDLVVPEIYIASIPIEVIAKILSFITAIMIITMICTGVILTLSNLKSDESDEDDEEENIFTKIGSGFWIQYLIFTVLSLMNACFILILKEGYPMSMFLFIYTPTLTITACVTYMLYSALKWEYIENKEVEKTHNPHHATPLHS